jgi:hypothetical protein
MKVAPRREFGLATPVLGGLQNDIEAQIKDSVGRDTRSGSNNSVMNGGSDAKSLVERISAASVEEIDQAIGRLQRMRAALLEHSEHIRRELATFERANENAAGSLRSVSDVLMNWRRTGDAVPQSEAAE